MNDKYIYILKKLKKNIYILVIYNRLLQRFIGIFLLPFYTKALQPNDYGAMALQAMHWVAANRVLVDVGGYHIQLVLGDVMSASCVLINWDVQSQGVGKYDSESTMVVDVAQLPATYEE